MSKYRFSIYSFLAILFFLFGLKANGQVLKTPVLGFTKACAKGNYNNFEVTISYSQKKYVDSNNLFILELSDSNGSFENGSKVQKLKEIKNLESFRFKVDFALPQGVFGEGYRIKVRSTHPERESISEPFGAYVLPLKRPTLNLYKDVSFCKGSNSQKISVTFDGNVADPDAYKYQWYKDYKPYKIGGKSIEINEEGFYEVEVFVNIADGNSCNTGRSNKIKATKIGAVTSEVYLNNRESEVGVCVNQSYVFKSSVTDKSFKYRWYKDNELIKDLPTYAPEYSTPASKEQLGVYRLEIEGDNTCISGSQDILLKEFDPSFEVTIKGSSVRRIILGESLELDSEVTVEDTSYKYQWYKDGKVLQEESDVRLTIDKSGVYFVEVTKSEAGCDVVVKSEVVEVKVEKQGAAVIPNILTPFTVDGINDRWEIPKEFLGESIKVVIYDAAGKEVFSKNNYQNNWPEEGKVKAGVLYYYRIFESDKIKKSGTISIIE